MTKAAFDKIAEGLTEALEIARNGSPDGFYHVRFDGEEGIGYRMNRIYPDDGGSYVRWHVLSLVPLAGIVGATPRYPGYASFTEDEGEFTRLEIINRL